MLSFPRSSRRSIVHSFGAFLAGSRAARKHPVIALANGGDSRAAASAGATLLGSRGNEPADHHIAAGPVCQRASPNRMSGTSSDHAAHSAAASARHRRHHTTTNRLRLGSQRPVNGTTKTRSIAAWSRRWREDRPTACSSRRILRANAVLHADETAPATSNHCLSRLQTSFTYHDVSRAQRPTMYYGHEHAHHRRRHAHCLGAPAGASSTQYARWNAISSADYRRRYEFARCGTPPVRKVTQPIRRSGVLAWDRRAAHHADPRLKRGANTSPRRNTMTSARICIP